MGIIERKEREKKIRREDILKAAEAVFFAKGYEGATMDEIANVAEYSKRTLYSYFQSKEQLLHGIIYRAYQALNRIVSDTLDEREDLNGIMKLKLLGKAYVRFIQLHPKYFEMIVLYNGAMSELPADDEFKVMSDLEGEKTFHYLVNLLQEGIKDSSVRADIDVTKTAFVLYANIIGMSNLALSKESYLLEHGVEAKEFIAEMFYFLEQSIANHND
ncbi:MULTISPECIES: TetR/AcrR family transcriptional regulator [Bacillus cereus group]|uniref:Transcriptional regulator, TetR family n=2 Tax=Bacillus cytotoxicus TaxID=580165 RepID=A0AAX2CLC5_9BACI|nr:MULTISPECIES: TetR/AcrR family transcriptional regulator [Bacillus cereus group]ABS23421.1 transcriptional regulator, TetR family [Bacillus cytotoxicus NVH 391-98]AWC30020.1 TetR/AcrR family transcriptional regulator [Bacillus cytotoxicus]AWC42156.1 TetR/AcrR family transcriptional regulator [Bacillus cytotoxicus]AWC46045.1 TetR/AcrR family transcriptional regulator [Bacillus cytotoxicus]AWC50087.1 TetR/AcrR family transcriptional regulator [Bacillus cytotoxicus]